MRSVLFICFRHQRDHFLNSHATELQARDVTVNFLLLDSLGSGRLLFRRSPFALIFHVIRIVAAIVATRPGLLVSITPIAGLSVTLCRWLTWGRPEHIHWFTGQVWCNFSGFKRQLLKTVDRFTCNSATMCLVDGLAQQRFLCLEGFRPSKLKVVGRGSICGFDECLLSLPLEKKPRDRSDPLRLAVVGRINREKGLDFLLDELPVAWMREHGCCLHFFGQFDGVSKGLLERFEQFVRGEACVYHGSKTPVDIYGGVDLLVLASLREGFSNVVIEAQAAGLPVVCRDIYALETSYLQGESGFKFCNGEELRELLIYLSCEEHRAKVGAKGRAFAAENFRAAHVVGRICDEYCAVLQRN